MASRRMLVKAVQHFLEAKNNELQLPELLFAIQRFCCSMKRPPHLTPNPKNLSKLPSSVQPLVEQQSLSLIACQQLKTRTKYADFQMARLLKKGIMTV